MKQFFVYALTFMAVMLPTLFFVVLAEKKEKRTEKKESLPLVFLLTRPIAELLEAGGVGNFFRKLFPGYSARIQKNLHFAGLKIQVGNVYCTQVFLAVFLALIVGGVTAMLVDRENRLSILVAGVIAAWIGGALPGVVIGNLAQRRQLQILRAIPYSIDLIASAMRGGLDFSAAIRFYVKLGIPGPLTEEYSQMLREMELGVIRTVALQNMADRIQIKEFTAFAAAIALLTDGLWRVLATVVSVMLPPMAIFFPLFTLLEDAGYLPRVAFQLDHAFQKAHACGKQCLSMCLGAKRMRRFPR